MSMSERDAIRLIDAYLDEALTGAEAEALDRWVAESAAHAELFVDRVELHTRLRDTLARSARVAAVETDALTDLAAAASMPSPARADEAESADMKILHQREAIPPAVWAFAAMAIVGIVLISVLGYQFRRVWFDAPSPDSPFDRVAILFEISDGAEFTYDGPGRYDPQLKQGEDIYPGVIDLKYGTLNISFESKAEVTLKAPAKFYLNHPKRARLERGELIAYCPEEAKGFTIGAPGCAVIDLGTRFWMKVDKLGFTDVGVEEGRVDLKRDNGEVVSLLRGATARAPRELTRRLAVERPQFSGPILTVVDTSGELYIDDEFARTGDELHAGAIDLPSGFAKLRLVHGAQLTLRGETRLVVDDAATAELERGYLSFDCPPDAQACKIRLPGHTVVAHGARLTLAVRDDADSELRATEGTVQVSRDNREPLIVEAGYRARLPRDPAASVTVFKPDPTRYLEVPNGDFTDPTLQDNGGMRGGGELDVGWIARDPGEMWIVRAGALHCVDRSSIPRAGVYFTKDERLTGYGWALRFDLEGEAAVRAVELWAGVKSPLPDPKSIAVQLGTPALPRSALSRANGTN